MLAKVCLCSLHSDNVWIHFLILRFSYILGGWRIAWEKVRMIKNKGSSFSEHDSWVENGIDELQLPLRQELRWHNTVFIRPRNTRQHSYNYRESVSLLLGCLTLGWVSYQYAGHRKANWEDSFVISRNRNLVTPSAIYCRVCQLLLNICTPIRTLRLDSRRRFGRSRLL